MDGPAELTRLQNPLNALAAQGIFIGTSSWKYPGWCGQIYDEAKYITRGKFSESRFERDCLAEYSETFPTVCVDAGYYQFPSEKYLAGLCSQVPAAFQLGIKVTDTITIKHYPKLPRFGAKAGTDNEHFLNAEIFCKAFLSQCERFKSNIGVLIFEFSQFHKADFAHGRDFIAALDAFFAQLPKGWNYAVEIRNKNFLHPEYFAMLRSHGVAHVFNSWTRMPGVDEQLAMEGSITADFTVARFLLKPGRTYEDAVATFSPYKETREVNETARSAAKALVEKITKESRAKKAFIFINNRLEGSAPLTIKALVESLGYSIAATTPGGIIIPPADSAAPPEQPDVQPGLL